MKYITISREEYDHLLHIRDLYYKTLTTSIKSPISAKEFALRCLDMVKSSNISFKQFAETTGYNLNTLYAWHQRKNIPEDKAKFLINTIHLRYPDIYANCIVDLDKGV